jgi:hypothetical protein
MRLDKATGLSLAAFGAFNLAAGLAGVFRETLDLGACILLYVGLALLTFQPGRPGFIVAALQSFAYAFSGVVDLGWATFDPTDSRALAQWSCSVANAVWGAISIGLLTRIYLARYGVPRYSLRSLFVVMTLAAVLFSCLRWLYVSTSPPEFATTDAIEKRYPEQLKHLRSLASSVYLTAAHSPDDPTNRVLFGANEIVEAGFQCVSDKRGMSHEMTCVKRNPAERRFRSLWRHGGCDVDHPAVSVVTSDYDDGMERKTVLYENMLRDSRGKRVRYFLEIDIESLGDAVP